MALNVEPVRQLLQTLAGSATAIDVADCLWLAGHLPPGAPRTAAAAPASAVATPYPAPALPSGRPRNRVGPSRPRSAEASASASVDVPPGPAADVSRAPSSALPGSLRILRSLRPFKRRVKSLHDLEIDETLTVEQIARGGLWLPVMRPVRERWLDLAVVVDESPLEPLWQDTVSAFVDTCRYLGGFRGIEVHRLRNVDGAAMLSTVGRGPARLRPPRTLLTAGRHQVILVVSDGLGPNWDDGATANVLARWGAEAPVALIQPLPERLWRHTWLGTVAGHLTAPERGAANADVRVHTLRDGILQEGAGATAVPVLELDRQWLRPWAHYTAGTSNHGIDAAVTFVGRQRRPARPDPMPAPQDPTGTVYALRTSVGPDTYRLAGLLAAVAPLTVPIMRHIQQRLLPCTGAAEIAELYLSSIFEPKADVGGTTLYDLRPGLRPVLLSTLRHHDIAEVVATVAEYLATDESLTDGATDMLDAEFARVSHPVLDRLGARDAVLGPSVRERTTPAPEPVLASPLQLVLDANPAVDGHWPDRVRAWYLDQDAIVAVNEVACLPDRQSCEDAVHHLLDWAETSVAGTRLHTVDVIMSERQMLMWHPMHIGEQRRVDMRLRWSGPLESTFHRRAIAQWRRRLLLVRVDARPRWLDVTPYQAPGPRLLALIEEASFMGAIALFHGRPSRALLLRLLAELPIVVWAEDGTVSQELMDSLTTRDILAQRHPGLRAVYHDEHWIRFLDALPPDRLTAPSR